MKDDEKTFIKCKKCYKNFKTIAKVRSKRKEIIIIQKRYQEETTGESGSLSYKSRDRNKSGESLSGFKWIQNF